eukprot:8102520-Alexandrium_andersonii.AAC.1
MRRSSASGRAKMRERLVPPMLPGAIDDAAKLLEGARRFVAPSPGGSASGEAIASTLRTPSTTRSHGARSAGLW